MKTNEKKVTNRNKKNKFKIQSIFTVVILIFVVVLIISLTSAKDSKSAVKDFITAINKADQNKFISLIDAEGCKSFVDCYVYTDYGIEYDFEKFKVSYNDSLKNIRKLNKEEKAAYENKKQSALETAFGTVKYSFFKNNEILEVKIKDIKTESVKGNKNITKVNVELESINRNGSKTESQNTFYTLKKGSKNYIISPGIGVELYF